VRYPVAEILAISILADHGAAVGGNAHRSGQGHACGDIGTEILQHCCELSYAGMRGPEKGFDSGAERIAASLYTSDGIRDTIREALIRRSMLDCAD